MPIIKTDENNLQVQFGTGDISIGSGMTGDYKHGFISFVPLEESKPIGSYTKHENPFIEMETIPVCLIFENIKSLDVMIERLQKTRKYMSGELDIKSEVG